MSGCGQGRKLAKVWKLWLKFTVLAEVEMQMKKPKFLFQMVLDVIYILYGI